MVTMIDRTRHTPCIFFNNNLNPVRMGTVITPPTYVEITGPLIFLAGPIQGAPAWHERAIAYIQYHAPQVTIASPKAPDDSWKFDYCLQVDWETHHLSTAAQAGVILFWLAKEHTHQCDRAYAQTTRAELFEWKNRKGRMVIGIEDGFTGARYIRHRFSQDRPIVPFQRSLEETCQTAIDILEVTGASSAQKGF